MSVYSARLWQVSNQDNAGSPSYSPVVPDNFIWVVRYVTIIGRSYGSDKAVLNLEDTDSVYYLVGAYSDIGDDTYYYPTGSEARLVMNPGERLQFYVDGGNVDLTVSGYQLTNYS